MDKIYCGLRSTVDSPGGQSCYVTVRLPRHKRQYKLKHHVLHSPDGFNWGYGGSGPAELARCMLIDFFEGNERKADIYYQDFKWKFIAPIQKDSFVITSFQIEVWLKIQRKEKFIQ